MAPKRIKFIFICVFAALIATVGVKIISHTDATLNAYLSPEDLYDNLAEQAIDLSVAKKPYVINFENKYPGNHRFYIGVEKPRKKHDLYCAREYEIKIDIFENKKLLVTKNIYAPCGEKGGANLEIQEEWYDVPEELPLRVPLNAIINVVQTEPEFKEHHGKAILAIQKLSDM